VKERRKHPRIPVRLPLEYWETDDACHGGLAGNISEMGLLIYSIKNIPVGTHLNIRVFFNNGYEFDVFQVRAKIVWKDYHSEGKWEAYQYGLEFTFISAEGRHKLVSLLNSRLSLESMDGSIQSIL
jgi:c-di-GMP-binding flagellar brake protein YcgR